MNDLAKVPILLILAVSGGCAHRHVIKDCPVSLFLDAPPEIGQILPTDEPSRCLTMTSSASLDPAYEVEAEGLTFTAATGISDRIVFVAVSDPAFRSPEGYRVGTQLRTIIRETGSQLKEERGWACFASLPSGWNAALPLTEGSSLKDGRWVDCTVQLSLSPEVGWFFKRK